MIIRLNLVRFRPFILVQTRMVERACHACMLGNQGGPCWKLFVQCHPAIRECVDFNTHSQVFQQHLMPLLQDLAAILLSPASALPTELATAWAPPDVALEDSEVQANTSAAPSSTPLPAVGPAAGAGPLVGDAKDTSAEGVIPEFVYVLVSFLADQGMLHCLESVDGRLSEVSAAQSKVRDEQAGNTLASSVSTGHDATTAQQLQLDSSAHKRTVSHHYPFQMRPGRSATAQAASSAAAVGRGQTGLFSLDHPSTQNYPETISESLEVPYAATCSHSIPTLLQHTLQQLQQQPPAAAAFNSGTLAHPGHGSTTGEASDKKQRPHPPGPSVSLYRAAMKGFDRSHEEATYIDWKHSRLMTGDYAATVFTLAYGILGLLRASLSAQTQPTQLVGLLLFSLCKFMPYGVLLAHRGLFLKYREGLLTSSEVCKGLLIFSLAVIGWDSFAPATLLKSMRRSRADFLIFGLVRPMFQNVRFLLHWPLPQQ